MPFVNTTVFIFLFMHSSFRLAYYKNESKTDDPYWVTMRFPESQKQAFPHKISSEKYNLFLLNCLHPHLTSVCTRITLSITREAMSAITLL